MRVSRRRQQSIGLVAFCMAVAVHAADTQQDPGTGCPASDIRALEQVQIDVNGMSRVSRPLLVPKDSAIMIAVSERIDVRIEATLGVGQVQSADSPLRGGAHNAWWSKQARLAASSWSSSARNACRALQRCACTHCQRNTRLTRALSRCGG